MSNVAEKANLPLQKEDPVEAIKAAWEGLYRLGDQAIEQMKAGAADGDIQAILDGQKSFDLVRDAMRKLRPVEDLAFLARRFKQGRKASTGGPIRKAIATALEKSPDLKNPEIWAVLAAKPPRGWNFFDSPALGRYLEGPDLSTDHMVYRRFCTVCGEERQKLSKQITG